MYIVGDIHGQYAKLITLLQTSGLIDTQLAWAAQKSTLWFMGDFVDRGPDGLAVVDLVMRLQREAAEDGGTVGALMGNHEPLLLGALLFPNEPTTGPGGTFLTDWERNGGVPADLHGLTDRHVDWLLNLPHMVHLDDRLLLHADALFYYRYGHTADEVNANMTKVLHSKDTEAWDHLLGDFSEREAFAKPGGEAAARTFLQTYGGRQIMHGHTPLHRMTLDTTKPYLYASGLCVNVDGGMYCGGPGFIHQT